MLKFFAWPLALFFLGGALSSGAALAFDSDKDELERSFEETAGGLAQPARVLEGQPIESSYLTEMMSGAVKQAVSEILKKNPFAEMTHAELKTLIEARTEGLPFGTLLKNNPKLMNIMIELLRNRKALPALVSVVNRPDKVKTFGIVAIAVFVCAFILNLFNSKGNIFKRILRKLSIGLGAFACNAAAFYLIFREEIGPTIDIILKYV